MANRTLANIRDRLERRTNIPTGDSYIDSQDQLDDINLAYEETAYAHAWPQILKRDATIIVADVNNYALPSDFRKFRYLYAVNDLKRLVEFDKLRFSDHAYAIDEDANDFVLSEIPQTKSTAYTTTNSETAANAVVVELDTVSGLATGDPIWVDNTGTNEFTFVSSVDTSATTITIRLKNSSTANDILYLTRELVHYQYYKTLTLLASSSDKTILPDVTDYIIPEYAAYLYFTGKEQDKRADTHLKVWQSRLNTAFLSHDKLATGASNEMTIDI